MSNSHSRKLGIEVGETTPDGESTLLTVECLGSCGTAPMMQVDETHYENLTEERIERVLAELELGTGDWWKDRGTQQRLAHSRSSSV